MIGQYYLPIRTVCLSKKGQKRGSRKKTFLFGGKFLNFGDAFDKFYRISNVILAHAIKL